MKSYIVFFHLLNDRSGSPRVLRSAIAALAKFGDGSRTFVGSAGAGILDEANVPLVRYWYKRSPYRLLTLFTYSFSQLCLLVRLLGDRCIARDALIYVNTLLPFGAALYGWITGRRVIYHLHEISISPAPLRLFLTAIARLTAHRLIYVSRFHRQSLYISVPAKIVYNPLDVSLYERARESCYVHRHSGVFNVLMVASLRDYKGVPEFLAVAKVLSDRSVIRFHLLANDDQNAIGRYLADKPPPANVTVHQRTDDPSEYYACSSLVLNLSRPDMWIETFGLTLLEAMAFGVPVIAPPVGGPVELVDDGVNGYLIDSRKTEDLAARIVGLADDPELCMELSRAARKKAEYFSVERFERDIAEAVLPLLESARRDEAWQEK